ncbi:MAG: histidine phosphatase family protein [Pseudomonadales bacterium]
MPQIYLVRHGQAAAGFDGHADPGLSELGRRQAIAVADDLAALGPLPVYSSPLARARETAQPLARRWQREILIEPRVAEIPSPSDDLATRSAWLRRAMAGRWSDLDSSLLAWRRALIDCVSGLAGDSVVFCHFIAINVVVGAAREDDRMVIFSPDNGSITRISTDGSQLQVLELGRTAVTRVN